MYVVAIMCWRALKTAGVDLDVAPTMDRWPVNSSTMIISWMWRPGEGSGRSWGSKVRTAPIEVAGALVEGGWGGAAVFASGAVGAGTAELAVEGDVGAGEGAEGKLASGEVDTEAAI